MLSSICHCRIFLGSSKATDALAKAKILLAKEYKIKWAMWLMRYAISM